MVAHLVRLKLLLLRNGLRRSVWQVVGLVFGVLYGLLVAALAVAGLVGLSLADLSARTTVSVLLGSLLVAGWWLIPLVAFGVDSTLDPARFVTFAIPRRSLLLGLGLSGLVGVPGALTTAVTVAAAVVWWKEPVALLVALLTGVVALATCVVGSRAITTAVAPLIAKRRVRELVAALVILPVFALGPAFAALDDAEVSLTVATFDGLAVVLGWTPVGAVWAVPAAVAAGQWGPALLHLLVALGTFGALLLLWDRGLQRALVTPVHESGGGRARGLGWFGRLPATPTWAVAARCLTYWVRDPRYAIAVAIVPLLPVILWAVDPDGAALMLLGPVVGFLLGWTISADLAYDGTAFWTHLAAPVRGVVDRAGRVLATSVVAVPTILVMTVSAALLTDRGAVLPALLGASLGLFGTALGASSVVSALVVYPVQLPGENPFGSKQGGSAAAFVSQLGGWCVVAVLALPEIVLALIAIQRGSAALGWVTLVTGVVLGGALLAVGIVVGGRAYDRTGPELLAKMRAFS